VFEFIARHAPPEVAGGIQARKTRRSLPRPPWDWKAHRTPSGLRILSKAGMTFDLVVSGGGITGLGIARLSAEMVTVRLLEPAISPRARSSARATWLHGGLRYLEHAHFLAVRGARAACRREPDAPALARAAAIPRPALIAAIG